MVIILPSRFTGQKVTRPILRVYANGNLLPSVLEASVTLGYKQDLGTAEITYPSPLPEDVGDWAKIDVVAGLTDLDPDIPYQGAVERFTGWVRGPGASMWPNTDTLHCEDILTIAKDTYTPEEVSFATMTDDQAIRTILTGVPPFGCGYSPDILDFGPGTGKILGDVEEAQLLWETGTPALEKIKDIDKISLGWRTYGKPNGRIGRDLMNEDPNVESELFWFYEGRHIIEGSMSQENVDPRNEIEIAGFGEVSSSALLDPTQDPFNYRQNSYWKRFAMLQRQAIDAGILSTEEQAVYVLSRMSKPIMRVTFSTHLGILFQGQEVVGITSSTLRCNQRFWVQSVQLSLQSDGSLTQTLTCISHIYRDVGFRTQVPPIAPAGGLVPGSRITYPVAPTPAATSDSDVLVNFTIYAIDQEYGAAATTPLSDHGAAIYAVACSDLSYSRTGTVATRAWTASGPGVSVPTGTDQTFTTGFNNLTGATITLGVTDSNGHTATKTLPVSAGQVPIRIRHLYSATDSTLEAWDGLVWRSFSAGGVVRVVANGPWWGVDNRVFYSPDDLQTTPTSATALVSGYVTAIWKHESNPNYLAVGGSTGDLAVSHDRGATWIPRTGPGGGAIQFVIVAIRNINEIHVVTSTGWHKSQNEGVNWAPVPGATGNYAYLELAPARNIIVTAAGGLINADTGQAFTFLGGGSHVIVAATAHIRSDRFYAMEDNGNTWYVEVPGSYELVPGAAIPDGGVPHHAGTYRDGTIVDLVYFASSTGLYKTMDGFKTTNAYVRLRQNGLLTP